MEPAIRRAEERDIPRLARLHIAAWRAAYLGILPQAVLDALSQAEFERTWEGLLRDAARTTLVACSEDGRGELLGFAAFRVEPEPEVIGLYVDPALWRAGIGRRLMDAALDALRTAGVRRVVLWVMQENARARAFYEQAGFAPTGGRRESSRYGVRFPEVEYALAS